MSARFMNPTQVANAWQKNGGVFLEGGHTGLDLEPAVPNAVHGRSRSASEQPSAERRTGDVRARLPVRSVSLSHSTMNGLPTRPDAMRQQARSSNGSDSRNTATEAQAGTQHGVHHVPRLSISSENGDPVDVVDIGPNARTSVASGLMSHHSARNITGARVHYMVLEVAMEIMEEIARICDSMWPPPTDISLTSAGLNWNIVDRLETWLSIRYEYYCSAQRLLEDCVTAELLAAEIIAQSPIFLSEVVGPKETAVRWDDLSERRAQPLPALPGQIYSNAEPQPQDFRLLSPRSPISKRDRKELTVKIVQDASSNTKTMFSPASANLQRSRTPASSSLFKQYRKDSPLPSGKKTGGIMLGLLTVGSMLGSPLHPQFEPPTNSVKSYRAVSASGYNFPSVPSPAWDQSSHISGRTTRHGASESDPGSSWAASFLQSRRGSPPVLFPGPSPL